MEPCFGISPVAVGSCRGYGEAGGRLSVGQNREVPELDQFCFARVRLCQSVKGLVECDDIHVSYGVGWVKLMQVLPSQSSAMLLGGVTASAIHQNPPHGFRIR